MTHDLYGTAFYSGLQAGSINSADVMVPYIIDKIGPSSVVDVGCGLGGWLDAYRRNGVMDYLGIDGEHICRVPNLIAEGHFLAMDLTAPIYPGRRFDLAQSLEVAEHFDREYAAAFVKYLTGLADIIVFSAAVPGQGGTHHVNVQRPEYWERLFRANDYILFDVFRPQFWACESVEWWYRHNMFLYVCADLRLSMSDRFGASPGYVFPPVFFLPGYRQPTRVVFHQLINLIRNSLKRRLGL